MSLRWWNTLAKNVAEPIFFEVVENLDTRMCMNYGFYREYRYCQCRTVSLCIKEWLEKKVVSARTVRTAVSSNVYLSLLHG